MSAIPVGKKVIPKIAEEFTTLPNVKMDADEVANLVEQLTPGPTIANSEIFDSLDQELFISQKQELDEKKSLLHESIKILDDREKEIIEERKLSENPKTLEELSKKYKISRERIRQIETRAFEKLQKAMLNSTKSKNLLPNK